MKPDVLLLDRFSERGEARLDAAYRVHRLYAGAVALSDIAPAIRAIVTSGAKGAPTEIVDKLTALEIIAIRGVGTDAVDLDRARKRSIRVTTTPGLLTEDVADLAIGLLITTARRICQGDRFVRAGQWRPGAGLPLGRKVTGMRIGIVGLGRVGRAIAERARGFSKDIAYTDLHAFADSPYPFHPTALALAEVSDALILAASGGPQSRNIIDKRVLDALGPQGLLVNVARGSLVDEPALVAALTEGRLGGAGLDVFVDEPNAPEALWRLETVVLQPHRASATEQTRSAMEDLVLANLSAHFSGEAL
ncbi:MAG TPA: 2-hydroxyacid dehydrogenase [Roseiarcus sp.]|nr:2-hydroxyacid dehydrogenase [Roseiarcus sp.]